MRVRGLQGGKPVDKTLQCQAVHAALHAQSHWPQLRQEMARGAVQVIISNTGDQGFGLHPADTVAELVGWRWLCVHLMVGAEIVYIQFQEPELTHGVGFTPKIKWMFEGTGWLRPYIEFAGGPFYTDLAGKIPEESSRFNFILTAGGGLSWFLTPQFSFNAGFRFHHISNAGTRYPNLGLNSGLPFGGFSFYF